MLSLARMFGAPRERKRLAPLYAAIVAASRDPFWYAEGDVPDTIDGRFDMIAAILSLVLLRLEAEGDAARAQSVLLTETFIDDMDGSLRQIGIGDFVVGKHVGKMMGALGGRLGAFRAAAGSEDGLTDAVTRNIFRDAPPSAGAVAAVSARLRRLAASLAAMPAETLLAGDWPA